MLTAKELEKLRERMRRGGTGGLSVSDTYDLLHSVEEALQLLATPAAPRERESPLTVKVEGGALVIAIGVETLAFAVLAGEVFQEGVTVPDPDKFAKEVVRELEQEREDGATPVHLLLDRAAERAAENGAEGIHFPDDDPPRALAPSTSGGK